MRVAFNRPEVRNAFRPHTVDELYRVLDHARMSPDVGVVLLTGNGPSPKDGGWAFCSGGDQRIRGRSGYQYASGETADTVDVARAGRLHILEVQRLIRFMPKVVICLVNGWAAGGGHSLHVVCDLTLASREHARFKQTDADVGSFDGGYGSAYLARQVGQKFAREIFFLGRPYTAEQMHHMGAVNEVVDHAELETGATQWAAEINAKSPQAQRMLKYAFNLLDDGLVGQQLFAGEATRLAYMTDEAVEGRDAFLEKRAAGLEPVPPLLLASRSTPAREVRVARTPASISAIPGRRLDSRPVSKSPLRRLTDQIVLATMRPPMSPQLLVNRPAIKPVDLAASASCSPGPRRASARRRPNSSPATAPPWSSSPAARICWTRWPTGSPKAGGTAMSIPATCPTWTPSTRWSPTSKSGSAASTS